MPGAIAEPAVEAAGSRRARSTSNQTPGPDFDAAEARLIRAGRQDKLATGILTAIVCVVILTVNGNIGAGIAVMGAFSLVRFRSVAGTAKEIGTIFLAMAAGLVVGMGYPGYAMLFTLVLAAAMVVYQTVGLGSARSDELERTLRITIPEDLNYMGVFDEVFARFTSCAKQSSVKTCNMGSLFKLTYDVTLLPLANE